MEGVQQEQLWKNQEIATLVRSLHPKCQHTTQKVIQRLTSERCLVLVIIGIRTLHPDRLALDMHLDTRRARPSTTTHRKLVLQPREPIVSDVLFPKECRVNSRYGIGNWKWGRGEED